MYGRSWDGRKNLGARLLVGDGAIDPLQHRVNLGEGGSWHHHGDEGGLLLKTFT
jgi:hypothetical protein